MAHISALSSLALDARLGNLVLWRSGRDYYAGGRKLLRMAGGGAGRPPEVTVYDHSLLAMLQGRRAGRKPQWLVRPERETVNLLALSNGPFIASLEERAVSFLQSTASKFHQCPIVVSWSGGKDSAVVSLLTQRAFTGQTIPHVFADTSIELPSTYEYLAAFRSAYPCTPILVSAPSASFSDLCQLIGPPSRIQRWCCSTQKAAPLSLALRAIGGASPVLCIAGLRASESTRRANYPEIDAKTKLGQQVQANPILRWSDFDVWVWTLACSVPINAGYRHGLDRIGCAFCPMSSPWSDMIGMVAWPGHYATWRATLVQFAEEVGLQDPDEFADGGRWRARIGGRIGERDLPQAAASYDIRMEDCKREDLAVNYHLSKAFRSSAARELLKAFGKVRTLLEIGDRITMEVSGPHGSFFAEVAGELRHVRVKFDSARAYRAIKGTLRAHLRKLQACVRCGACSATCPYGALRHTGEAITINEALCAHCLACVREVGHGCIAAHSLSRGGGDVRVVRYCR